MGLKINHPKQLTVSVDLNGEFSMGEIRRWCHARNLGFRYTRFARNQKANLYFKTEQDVLMFILGWK